MTNLWKYWQMHKMWWGNRPKWIDVAATEIECGCSINDPEILQKMGRVYMALDELFATVRNKTKRSS